MPDHRNRARAALAATVLLAAVALVLRVRGSFFFADDWLNFGLASERRMSGSLLFESYFGHFAPGHRLGDWLLTWKLPASWTAALVIGMACWTITVGATWWLLRELRTTPALVAVGTLLVAASPAWVRLLQWWASAAHVAPGMAASAVAAAAAFRWFATRARWALVLSVGAVAGGLLFYEKPALVVGYVVLLRYIVLPERLSWRATGAAVRGDWPILIGYATVIVAYVTVVLVGGYSNTAASGADAGQWAEYLWRNWTEGVAPLIVGQASPDYAPPIPLLGVLAAQVVIVGLVVLSVRRRRRAWRAWAGLAVAWIVSAAIIGVGRLTQLGPGVGLDPRYNAEMVLVLAVTIAVAFRGPTDARARAADPTTGLGARRRRPAVGVALVAGSVLVAAISTTDSSTRIEDSWQGPAARAWRDTLRRSAARLREQGVRYHVVDGAADPRVVAGSGPPYDRLSLIVPLITDGVTVGDQPGVAATIAPDGTIVVPRRDRPRAGAARRPFSR